MRSYPEKIAALVLAFVLVVQVSPLSLYAEETTESSSSSSEASSTTSEESSSSTSESSSTTESSASEVSMDTESESSTDTYYDNLEIHATTSADLDYAIEEVLQTAASSTSGFVNVTGSTTATSTEADEDMATSSDETATSSPDGTNDEPDDAETATSTEEMAEEAGQTIITGDAIAIANILNLLNASFVNSSGAILFGNYITETGDIDLRDGSLFSACADEGCSGLQGVQLNLLQDAYILNSLLLSANSGDNQISTSSTSTAILTGNAFAGLNLVNLANVSFVNSNYLLATLNAFQGVDGDIVFPSLYDFFSALTSAVDPDAIQLTNSAEVNNSVSAEALTGENAIQNVDGAQVIQTGTSEANTNIFNQINSLLAGEGVSILLRITGAFNGEIWGLPDNVFVTQTPMGLYISGRGTGVPDGILGLGITGTSTAIIDNDVDVSATTGENGIENTSSTALISTGDAFAGANIINIANQTVIGRNWMLAVFNIFGDLSGNIAFGRPDLWVGARADAPAFVENGSPVRYTITVKNRGDSVVNNAFLTETIDLDHLDLMDASREYELDGNVLRFSLGSLSPGQTIEISYDAEVKNAPPGTSISSLSQVAGRETDNDMADNTDGTTIRTTSTSSGGGGGGGIFTSTNAVSNLANGSANSLLETTLSMFRSTEVMQATKAAPSVTQSIVLKNTGTTLARNVVLQDILHAPNGDPIYIEEWNIREIAPGEELLIQYQFTFGSNAPLGRYGLSTTLWGQNIATSTSGTNGYIDLVAYESGVPFYQQAPVSIGEIIEPYSNTVQLRTGSTSAPLPGVPDTSSMIETAPEEALVAAAGSVDTNLSTYFTAAAFFLLIFVLVYQLRRYV